MKTNVQTYSGHKADERPVSFTLDNRIYRVVDIVDRYYNPDEDIFKVTADDGNIYILGHFREDDRWELKAFYRP